MQECISFMWKYFGIFTYFEEISLSWSLGADKTVKGPDGLTAFEATDNQAIKTLLQ
uniref:Uncharacterized protein n=1 Tax=Meleagris gallopavo TaxID=9103 RepID=A0A803YJJ2_MELGA